MKPELISIIVPIYNVERYLPRCLDSIIEQTYPNIEIMLVDDGSPDNSGVICDKYAQHDERIRVFHISNGGVAKARQLGVKNSSGKYIVFVDPDDWLPLDSIDILYNELTDETDIVIGSNIRYYENGDITLTKHQEQKYYCHDYIRNLLQFKIHIAPWGRIYRKKLFTENSFPNFRRSQDFLMNIDVACKVNHVKIIPKYVYNYRADTACSSLKKYTYTLEYYRSFCFKISEILKQANLFATLQKDYAICSLYMLFETVKGGGEFNGNDPFVKEVKLALKKEKLRVAEKIMLLSFNSKSTRKIISHIFKIMQSNKTQIIRNVVHKILNK